jgi:cytochrome c biogenesis protein CcmG/thiol:disulfide interchange protein DsbE
MKAKAAAPRDNRKLVLYVTLAAIAIALVVAVGFASRVPKAATEVNTQAKLSVGQTAPEFAASTTAGPFDLATAKGPVFLEVFATWCPHCQRETQVLNQVSAQYGHKINFVAVAGSPYGIDGSSPETQLDVVAFANQFHVNYPVAFDPDLTVAKSYLQAGFPTMVIIGADKKIHWIGSAEIPAQTLETQIRAVL